MNSHQRRKVRRARDRAIVGELLTIYYGGSVLTTTWEKGDTVASVVKRFVEQDPSLTVSRDKPGILVMPLPDGDRSLITVTMVMP